MSTPTSIITKSITDVPSNYQRPFEINSPSEFLPTMIPNLTLWVDAADTSSNSLNLSGTSVLNWYDKSGNNNTGTAGTTKPTLNYRAINGRPAILFTSTGSSATATYFSGSFSSTFTGSFLQGFIVATMSSTSGQFGRLFSLARPGVADVAQTNTTFLFCRNNSGQNVMIGRNNDFLTVSIPAYDTPFIGQSSQQNGTEYIGINGTLAPSSAATANSGAFNISSYGIATNNDTNDSLGFHSGFIGEVIYYTAQLTTAQIQQVEGYLAWKWGLQGVLPATHPYSSANQTPPYFPLVPIPITRTIFNKVWLPSLLSSGFSLWLDGADPSTIAVSSGTNVSSWSDKSGNGRTASLITAAGTVSYSSSTNAIVFAGSGALNSSLTIGTTSPLTCFILFNSTGLNTFRSAMTINGYGATRPNLLAVYQSSTNYIWFSGGSAATDGNTSTTLMTANTRYIVANYWQPSLTQVNVNGTFYAASANAPASLTNTATLLVGSTVSGGTSLNEYWSGSVFEVIVYNATLTTFQRQQVEGYLAWKWGLQSSLTLDHPYRNFPPSPP